jgi:hypothetical protein
MLEENEIQKRGLKMDFCDHLTVVSAIVFFSELERLLKSTKDGSMRENIMKSIADLEEETTNSRDTFNNNMHTISPSVHASLYSSPQVAYRSIS